MVTAISLTADALIDHWQTNWRLALEECQNLAERLAAAEAVIDKIGHHPTCRFIGCSCGQVESLRAALQEWARVKQETKDKPNE